MARLRAFFISSEIRATAMKGNGMTREMTGAEMVIQALADQNVEHVFGYPGGAVLPIYDAHLLSRTKVTPHPGPARAGRGARRGRLCALDRQGRLRAGDVGSRRHQCGHRPDRRAAAIRFRSSASPDRCRRI